MNQPDSVSFKLNAKTSKSVVSSLATLPSVSTKPQFEDALFIDQSGIQTSATPQPKKGRHVIPLTRDPFYNEDTESPADIQSTDPATSTQTDTEDAIKEAQISADPLGGQFGLIERKPLDSRTSSGINPKKRPLLSRSRPPGWRDIKDESERLKAELAFRPEYDESAFEEVPIDGYGDSLLLGMGWNPDDKTQTKVIELTKRPERLGLGAKAKLPPPPPPGKFVKPSEYKKPVEAMSTSHPEGWKLGQPVYIVSGEHEGSYGTIRTIPKQGTQYTVQLRNDELVQVDLRLLIDVKRKKLSDAPDTSDSSKSHSYHKTQSVQHEKPKSSSSSSSHSSKMWIAPNIRVKVRSKTFKNGKYYCKKGTIIDVATIDHCTVRFDDGTVVDDASQRDLETVIPAIGGRAIVVLGRDTGITGILHKKFTDKDEAVLQIDDTIDFVTFHLDDIAELAS